MIFSSKCGTNVLRKEKGSRLCSCKVFENSPLLCWNRLSSYPPFTLATVHIGNKQALTWCSVEFHFIYMQQQSKSLYVVLMILVLETCKSKATLLYCSTSQVTTDKHCGVTCRTGMLNSCYKSCTSANAVDIGLQAVNIPSQKSRDQCSQKDRNKLLKGFDNSTGVPRKEVKGVKPPLKVQICFELCVSTRVMLIN